MIIWFTGNSGAGKTTKAKRVIQDYADVSATPPILLDGDDMRKVWTDLTLSEESRWTQNIRIAKLARLLQKQGFDVVVATICPYREVRKTITECCNPKFIYLKGGRKPSETDPYE